MSAASWAADVAAATAVGAAAGKAAGSWVIDGNTSAADAAALLRGIADGDPAVMDLCPSPLSGEWAEESIPELSDRYGFDLTDDETATAYETAFADAFWAEVERAANAVI